MSSSSKSKSNLKDEFNEWADAGRGEGMKQGHWDMTIQTIEKMNLHGNETVLDLGCGNGWAVRELATRLPNGRVIGMDIADKMIREANVKSRGFHNVEYYVASADEIPADDSSLDHILSVESFYYNPDLEPVLREIRRILKPGAFFWCIVDLYRENPYSMTWPELLNVPVHALGESEYRQLFDDHGFTVTCQDRIVDRRPVDESRFSPGWGTNTLEEYREYKAMGSLLTVSQKQGESQRKK